MNRIKEKSVIFRNLKGEKLWGVLGLPVVKKKIPAVIIVHGFNGTKSARKFVKIGREFAKGGIAVLRFDFSGCGDSEGDFQRMSISQEIKELALAHRFLINQPQIDKNRIGFLGYSLGALIACLFQDKNPVAKNIVLVAPAINQEKLIKIWNSPYQIQKWRGNRRLDAPKYRIGLKYLKEAKDYTSIISKINIPILIIHGSKDEDVPLRFSRELIKFSSGRGKINIIKGGDHNFENYKALNELVKASLKWFKKYL